MPVLGGCIELNFFDAYIILQAVKKIGSQPYTTGGLYHATLHGMILRSV